MGPANTCEAKGIEPNDFTALADVLEHSGLITDNIGHQSQFRQTLRGRVMFISYLSLFVCKEESFMFKKENNPV